MPVLVATARDDDREVIRLLNAGADDYMVKPFSGGQLAARIAAVLRRSAPDANRDREPVLQVADLRIDTLARTVHLADHELSLDPARVRPARLPRRQRRPGHVPYSEYSPRCGSSRTWRTRRSTSTSPRCAAKLGEKASRPRYLHTVRGIGIKLVSSP